MAYQTDTDASLNSSVGVGEVDQVVSSLYTAQPNWLADGYGIRGPQRQAPAFETNIEPFPMEVKIFRASSNDAPPQTSGGDLTVTDGFATVTGVTKISFDGGVFFVSDYGGGEAHVECA